MPDGEGFETFLKRFSEGTTNWTQQAEVSAEAVADVFQSLFSTLDDAGPTVDSMIEKVKIVEERSAKAKNAISKYGDELKKLGLSAEKISRVAFKMLNDEMRTAEAGLKRYAQLTKTATQLEADKIRNEINAITVSKDVIKNQQERIKVLKVLGQQEKLMRQKAAFEQIQKGPVGQAVGAMPGPGGAILAGAATGGVVGGLVVALKSLSGVMKDNIKEFESYKQTMVDIKIQTGMTGDKFKDVYIRQAEVATDLASKYGLKNKDVQESLVTLISAGFGYKGQLDINAESMEKSAHIYRDVRKAIGFSNELFASSANILGKQFNVSLDDFRKIAAKTRIITKDMNLPLGEFAKHSLDLTMKLQEFNIPFGEVATTLEKNISLGYGYSRALRSTQEMMGGVAGAGRAERIYAGRAAGMGGSSLAVAARVRFGGFGQDESKKFMNAQLKKMGYAGTMEEMKAKIKDKGVNKVDDATLEAAEKLAMVSEKMGISERTVFEQLGIVKKQKDIQSQQLKELEGIKEAIDKNLKTSSGQRGLITKVATAGWGRMGEFWRRATAKTTKTVGTMAAGGMAGMVAGIPFGPAGMGAGAAYGMAGGLELTRGGTLEGLQQRAGGVKEKGEQVIRFVMETNTGEVLKEFKADIIDGILTVIGQ